MEINEIEAEKTIEKITEKINETKSYFFEKIDKPLARFTKAGERELKQIKLEMKVETLQFISQKYKKS